MADIKGKLFGWTGHAHILHGTEKRVGVLLNGHFDHPEQWEPGWYRLRIEHQGQEYISPSWQNSDEEPVFRFTGSAIVRERGGDAQGLRLGFTDYAALGRPTLLLVRDYERMVALGWRGIGPRVWFDWRKVPGCAVIDVDGRLIPEMRFHAEDLLDVCRETFGGIDVTLSGKLDGPARLHATDVLCDLLAKPVERGLRVVADLANEADSHLESGDLAACLIRARQRLPSVLWTVSYSNFVPSPGHGGSFEDPSNEGRWYACQKVRGIERRSGGLLGVYAFHFPRTVDWHRTPSYWLEEVSAHLRDRWQDGPAPLLRPLYWQEDRRCGDQQAGGSGPDPSFEQFVSYFQHIDLLRRAGKNVFGACFHNRALPGARLSSDQPATASFFSHLNSTETRVVNELAEKLT